MSDKSYDLPDIERLRHIALSTLVIVLGSQLCWANSTVKTVVGTTYCIDPAFVPEISTNVASLRAMVADARREGKLVGYISVPISPAGGGDTQINKGVSTDVKRHLEKTYAGALWMLSPATQEATLPDVNGKSAGGQEYMYMWTQVLAGDDGEGRDFDLFYFVGRSDFWRALRVTDDTSIVRLRQLADERGLSGDKKIEFLKYYAFRASADASRGSHDEWNMLGLINRARRKDIKVGVAGQIVALFDGRQVSPGELEGTVSAGYEGTCGP
jgi:hypothetical protein